MANSYFRFKQFTINQESCAMKVNTDGVILGAWASPSFSGIKGANKLRILDIGTGTGVISLMLAQRFPKAEITAIEIEKDAANQAKENVSISPWKNRVEVIEISVQEFIKTKQGCFDLIVCNPPFFEKDFRSGNLKKDTARHAAPNSLMLPELFKCASILGVDGASLAIVLPIEVANNYKDLSVDELYGWHSNAFLYTRAHVDKPAKRLFWSMTLNEEVVCSPSESELVLGDGRGVPFTPEYKTLTKDFYLHF